MSSITPQSFVDDGGSFTKRIPRGLDQRHIAKWIASNGSDTSAYTGSFVDDGADMHLPLGAAPGFGPIDTRFYKQRKLKGPKHGAETLWNGDVQKAISGDIQRNLEKIRGLGRLEVKRTNRDSRQDGIVGEQKQAKKDTVTIPMPPQWGTFVIKADNGRVIVVDKDGEFDSGPRKTGSEQPKHWVKAASTIEPSSPVRGSIPPSLPKHRTCRMSHERSKESRKEKTERQKEDKHKKSRQSQHSPPIILTPIPESEYEDRYLPSGGEDIGSPTGFMMTGGASGWPSSRATSVTSPVISVSDGYEYIVPKAPIKAISEGFRHVSPRSSGHKDVVPELNSWTKEKKTSNVRSPPGGWPSPELSSAKETSKAVSEKFWDGGQFESAWKASSPSQSHKTDKSHGTSRSGKSRNSKKDSDNASVKSYTTYKAPTVEDAANISAEEKEEYVVTGWGGSVKSSSTQDWGRNKKNSEKSFSTPHPHTWASSKSPSEQSWSKRLKAADNHNWTDVEHSTFQQHASNPTSVHSGSPTRPSSDATWDGFEKRKSISEVSVVDIRSERGSLGHHSRLSSRQSSHRSHHSQGTRGSHRSSRHAQTTGWEDSQTGWAGGNQSSHKIRDSYRSDATAGWPGSRVISEQSWSNEKARVDDGNGDDWGGGDEDKGKYANGFDEDNATYLNDDWGDIPVRVGSRAGSKSSRLSSAEAAAAAAAAAGWE
ncbi:uncharacterized protein ALTATR162_LOCUS5583 [Alternaria atra]|uniref:Uncharacterized protein n=1 Tax=Alternaria atra TaxID=119953 RepID=A0A8J2N1T3_9PLEO|nr:uncharacterized protein ALTATR162_LOCUS5583 [Alternaria atra]CAG5159437.1 unnamed protein product [Alternaria atra]